MLRPYIYIINEKWSVLNILEDAKRVSYASTTQCIQSPCTLHHGQHKYIFLGSHCFDTIGIQWDPIVLIQFNWIQWICGSHWITLNSFEYVPNSIPIPLNPIHLSMGSLNSFDFYQWDLFSWVCD